MQKLEKCVHEVESVRLHIFRGEYERCFTCTDKYKQECKEYKPARICEVPVRFGRYACSR